MHRAPIQCLEDRNQSCCGDSSLNIISFCCQRHAPTVPHTGDRTYVTGSIRGWSRWHLTYSLVAADSKSASLLRSLPQLLLNFQFKIILPKRPLLSRILLWYCVQLLYKRCKHIQIERCIAHACLGTAPNHYLLPLHNFVRKFAFLSTLTLSSVLFA